MGMNEVNWKRPLALAIVLFVLGSAAYWFEFRVRPQKEEAEQEAKKIFNLKDVGVTTVKIFNGNSRVELSCLDVGANLCKSGDNSKWQVLAPLKTKADDSNANALLSSLNNLSVNETISLKDETPEKRASLLKEYGLSPEQRKADSRFVELTNAKGVTVTAYLGGTNPIGETIFTLVANQGKADEATVYLVPSYFKSNLEHDLTYWRDKRIFAFNANDVESFSLKSDKNNIEAVKENGGWTLKPKGQSPIAGDIENVDNLASALAYLTAKGFASDSKADQKAKDALKGAKMALQMEVRIKGRPETKAEPKINSEAIKFTVYQKDKKGAASQLFGVASNADPLYELEPGTRNRLDKELKDLRLSKLITSMERFTIKRMEFAGAQFKQPLVIENKDGKWTNASDHKEVSGDKVQNLLDRLSGNRIKEFLKAPSAPAGEKSGLSVVLSDEKGEKKRDLVFWQAADKLYAKDRGNQASSREVFLVDTAVKDALPWDEKFFGPPPAPAPSPSHR